jgi:hypothetical protein
MSTKKPKKPLETDRTSFTRLDGDSGAVIIHAKKIRTADGMSRRRKGRLMKDKPPSSLRYEGRVRREKVKSAGRGLPGVAMREAGAAQPYRLDR